MKGLSTLLFILSGALVITGFIFMFHYGNYDDDLQRGNSFGHIVGGDAYNYMINGIRGLGFIISAVISSIVASAILIYSKINLSVKIEQVES